MLCVSLLFVTGLSIFSLSQGSVHQRPQESCDTISQGYNCHSEISHFWGPYSPYFSVPSAISPEIPPRCTITFAQIISRHGARDPTLSKSESYNRTIHKIKGNVHSFTGDYAFLADFTYDLGADQLTKFGEQEMLNSGIKFSNRYRHLSPNLPPFIRASGQQRVVESAQKFAQGYHIASQASTAPDTVPYPYKIVTIPETPGSNNTLSHNLCTAFESLSSYKLIASLSQETYASHFLPQITTRLNTHLPGANLTSEETISLLSLCPFHTVSSSIPLGSPFISPFCYLFTETEWREYDYYQSLGKYYGYGSGNPLGPTQGVGFANELIARLTSTPVRDHTTVNQTLDANPATFPLNTTLQPLFADFTHDNDITAIFSALGLYNSTPALSNTTLENVTETNGYAASWTVPFGARAYFEKLTCAGEKEEYVRVLVNDRVLPLETCGGDERGMCSLSAFVDSLGFARAGGKWEMCFERGFQGTRK